jgi:MFS family permease
MQGPPATTEPARDFQRVLAAESVSNFGSMLSRLAIPWLAALALRATPADMAALLLADVGAGMLGTLWLGAWVDRRGKRALMLACDAGRCAVLGLLALAAWQGRLHFGGLLLAAACSGVLTVAFEIARSAWTAQRVPAEDLPRRNAQLSVAGSVSEALAFALGGWIYQALGAVLALVVDALSYAGSALCLRGVREAPGHRDAPPATGWRARYDEAQAGLRVVAAVPALRVLAVAEGLGASASALFGTSVMIYVSRDLGLPTGPLGMVFALGALGSIVGAALAPGLGQRFGPARTMTLGLALLAVGLACAPLATGAGYGALALLAAQQIVGDAGHSLQDVHDRTLRQTLVPADRLARADAGLRTVGQAAVLAGALAGGAIGTAWGARPVLWLAAVLVLLSTLWVAWRLPRAYAMRPST